MKYMSIDYGTKRVGLAVSDLGGRMAFPRRTLAVSTRDRLFAELGTVLEQEAPDALVVGLPLSMDGSASLTTRQVCNFVERLKRRTTLPVFLMNEQLSSFEAEQDLRDAGLDVSSARAVVDQQAAVRILESFLAQPEPLRRTA